MAEDLTGRAELIVELQAAREDGAGIPLMFSARELGSLPLQRVLALLTEVQSVGIDTDAVDILPQAMNSSAADVRDRLATLVGEGSGEAGQVALLHMHTIVDYTLAMGGYGAAAKFALTQMYAAIETAVAEAHKAEQAINAARREAEAAAAAQNQFAQTLDGYIEEI